MFFLFTKQSNIHQMVNAEWIYAEHSVEIHVRFLMKYFGNKKGRFSMNNLRIFN